MDKDARLTNLALRDRLAREHLGAAGERLERLMAERLEARMQEAAPPDGTGEEGIFDLFVWNDFATGTFHNLDRIHLRWAGRELMEYRPDRDAPFAFTDATGHRIEPGPFLTDGGTIPSFATGVSGITRWGYGPSFLIHDWEYSLKHCDRLPPGRDRERVDAALLEALKTLMVEGEVDENRRHFWKIETALANFAGAYWNADTPCSLPLA